MRRKSGTVDKCNNKKKHRETRVGTDTSRDIKRSGIHEVGQKERGSHTLYVKRYPMHWRLTFYKIFSRDSILGVSSSLVDRIL